MVARLVKHTGHKMISKFNALSSTVASFVDDAHEKELAGFV